MIYHCIKLNIKTKVTRSPEISRQQVQKLRSQFFIFLDIDSHCPYRSTILGNHPEITLMARGQGSREGVTCFPDTEGIRRWIMEIHWITQMLLQHVLWLKLEGTFLCPPTHPPLLLPDWSFANFYAGAHIQLCNT